jgi:hypothetical protein
MDTAFPTTPNRYEPLQTPIDDVPNLWLKVERGIVRTVETKAKTEASRRGVPVPPELMEVLLEWREQALYRADDDWMFASEQTGGNNPIWLDVALERHIRLGAKDAGIHKRIGWHTFRRSLAMIIAAKTKDIKVAQELLRHANSAVTADLYAQGDVEAQRAAQGHVSGLFFVGDKDKASWIPAWEMQRAVHSGRLFFLPCAEADPQSFSAPKANLFGS